MLELVMMLELVVLVEISHEEIQIWVTLAVAPVSITAPFKAAQDWRVLIMSVAVMSPLSLEYATVVVKLTIMPSSEHVS